MATLLFLALLLVALVYAFRWLRRREIEAFMDADSRALEAALRGTEMRAPAASALRAGPGAVPVAVPAEAPATLPPSPSPPAEHYLRRNQVFDEVTRSFLVALDEVIGSAHRVFIDVPVGALVRHGGAARPGRQLPGLRVSFVICSRKQFAVCCVLQLVDGSEGSRRRLAELQAVLSQVGIPLLPLRPATDYSPPELRERLEGILG